MSEPSQEELDALECPLGPVIRSPLPGPWHPVDCHCAECTCTALSSQTDNMRHKAGCPAAAMSHDGFEASVWQSLRNYHHALDEDTAHVRPGVLALRFVREIVAAAENYAEQVIWDLR